MSNVFNDLLFLAAPFEKRKRVGRGRSSGLGKTCGKGGKGQSARAGYSRKAYFEGGQMPLYRRIPKWGFSKSVNRSVGLNVNRITSEEFVADPVTSVRLFGLSVPETLRSVSVHSVSKGCAKRLGELGVKVNIIGS